MKSVLLLRLLLALTLTFGLSTPQLLAQDDEKTEKEEEAPQRGQRGQRGQGQRGGQAQGGIGNMSEMTKEERMAHLNKIIQTNVIQMVEAAEVRDDQQQAFVKVQAKFEVELIKVMGQMQSVGRDRNKRQKLMQSRTKAASVAAKEIKNILDKAQFKLYTAKMKERTPQQRRGGGGRGR